MSNGERNLENQIVETNVELVEQAEELLESHDDISSSTSSLQSEKVVQCIQVDILDRKSFQNDGDNSAQSSAAATPFERSQEVTEKEDIEFELKEWSSLVNILARIPVKAQKGLSRFDLKLTCISTIGDEILLLGTNVGIVYWYNRRTDVLDRLRCEGVNAVTCLSCIGTVDYMVAAGNQVGLVTIFQIPRDATSVCGSHNGGNGQTEAQYERRNKKSQKFQIQDLHKGAITSLEWSNNGMKLFSGDQTGHVVLTDIDYDLVQIRSCILLCENYEIVQLSYTRKNLLICSTFRSIIYVLESKTFNQVGSLERKIMGRFGGLVVSSAWEESPKVYSVRPGARLWVANLSGLVQHTVKFKELIVAGSQPEIHILTPKTLRNTPPDIQFTKLYRFMKDYLITHHKDILLLVDPRNTKVLGVCKQLRSILDVAVNRDEIFILESSRNVIRLSAKADNFSTLTSANANINCYLDNYSHSSTTSGDLNSSSNAFLSQQLRGDTFLTHSVGSGGGIKNIPDIMSASISDFRFPQEPINFLTSKLKETSEKVIPKINPLLNTIKTVIEADVDIEDGQTLLEAGLPPPVIPLEAGSIADALNSSPCPSVPEEPVFIPEPERFQKITHLPFEDVLVDSKPIRKPKKNTRKKLTMNKKDGIAPDTASDSVSVSSAYSNTSGSDTNTGNVSGTALPPPIRKLSFKSDYTLSSSNSGSDGVMSASEHPQLPIGEQCVPVSMSKSWSVGTFVPSKAITLEELHLKEELLARRLKWPELLPESTRNSDNMFDDEVAHDAHRHRATIEGNENGDSSEETRNLNGKFQATRREDRVSVSTLIAPSADENTDTDSKTISLENGSSYGTVIERTLTNNPSSLTDEDKKDQSNAECCEEDKYYMDIYSTYRNKDSISSYNSVLSFGPPSGSSYISTGAAALGVCAAVPENGNSVEENDNVSEVTTIRSNADIEEELGNSKEKSYEAETTASSVVEELDSIVESKVVIDEHWKRWRLPGPIIQICLCDHYILCVCSKGNVIYASLDTVTLHWKTTGYSASSMAISPCGSIVWRIHKGDLYSLTNLASSNAPIGNGIEQWTKLTYKKVVLCAAVQRSFGWIVKVDGSLEFCTGLLTTTMVPYFETVYTPWPIQEVSCFEHRLWGLTSDGRIVFRTRTSHQNPKGVDWLELKWCSNDVPPACSISCGNVRKDDGVASVWFSDSNGDLYFTFEERDSRGAWIPWKVSASCYVQAANSPEQSKSVIFNSIKEVSKSIKSFVQQSGSRTGLFLASSKSSVWFSAPDTSVIHGNRNSIVGHNWRAIRVDKGLSVPSTWTSIYANSIYRGHGYLWISDSKGNLFYLPHGGGKVQPIDLPMFSNGQILAVAPAPEALWILSNDGYIHGRSNITSTDCVGKDWREIRMSTFTTSQFVHISCGSDVAWAVDDLGDIYMRVGSLKPPGMQDMSPAWNKVESSVCCKGMFSKVFVSANGSMVWALDSEGQVYVRQAVYPDYPIGTGWLLVKGINATILALSDSAVWALTPEKQIYRRHGISTTNFVGDFWRKVPGMALAITVSLCDELWALAPDGYLLKHSKKEMTLTNEVALLNGSSSSQVAPDEDEDEDWEIVDNLEV